MRHLIATAGVWLVLIPVTAAAQTVGGWITGGFGQYANRYNSDELIQVRGGAEIRSTGPVGAAIGLGVVIGGGTFAALSGDVVFHAQSPGRALGVVPFVAAGLVRLGSRARGWQVRGGVDWWRDRSMALRLEVQWITQSNYPARAVFANVGLTFR